MWRIVPTALRFSLAVIPSFLVLLPCASAVAATCPDGTYRNSSVVWKCSPANDTVFLVFDESTDPKVQIPQGVKDLSFTAVGNANLTMVLQDPSSAAIVASAGDGSGVINPTRPSGTYKNMDISCQFQVAFTTCQIAGSLSIPLEVEMRKQGTQVFFPLFAYSHVGLETCPDVLPGCPHFSEEQARRDVKAWSRWMQCRYSTLGADEAAFDNLTDIYHVELPGPDKDKVVPWFMWGGVWSEWDDVKGDAYQAMNYLDTNHDDVISKDEFVAGYFYDPDGCDSAPISTAQGWWPRWFVWWLALASCLLLACCFCAVASAANARGKRADDDHLVEEEPLSRDREHGLPVVEEPLLSHHSKDLLPSEASADFSPTRESTPVKSVGGGPQAPTFDRLLANPELRFKVEEHPASLRFHQVRMLGYSEELTNGFRAAFSKEVLFVDARQDAALHGFMTFLHDSQQFTVHGPPSPGSVVHIVGVAKAISMGFGGGVNHEHVPGEGVQERWEQRSNQLRLHFPQDLPIGLLLGRHDPLAGLHAPGAGLQRHRAVLFKYVCDTLQICKSALLWDAKRDTAINVAWTGGSGGRPMLVDCAEHPGQLKEAYDLHHVVLQMERESGSTGDFPGF